MTYKRVYRFCDGEIVDGLNRRRYNPKKDEDMQCICTIINAMINQGNEQDQQIRELKEDNKQYKLIVESLKDENQKLKLRLKDLGVEYY